MKTLKMKSVLVNLLAIMAVTVFLTSCGQESIVIEDIEGLNQSELDEVISPPLTPEELNAVWGELEQDEENIAERSSNCACKRVYATRRSNTSSYVYCQRWQDNSTTPVLYQLIDNVTNEHRTASIANYYHTFGYPNRPLISGRQYKLKNRLGCEVGSPFVSNYYTFTQNSYYPSPHVYY